MRILILGNCNSIHIKRWCLSLNKKGIEIAVWSLSKSEDQNFSNKIKIFSPGIEMSKDRFYKKLLYLSSLRHLKRTLKEFKPNITHAHYLSSYGILGMFMIPKNYIVSVWGSDIYKFPNQNKIFKLLTSICLNRADRICSTSRIMGVETNRYTSKKVEVVPFGVNLTEFKMKINPKSKRECFVVGTIKALESIYGIDILIQAFNIFHNTYPEIQKKLVIVGDGSQKKELTNLVRRNSLVDYVEFVPAIPHNEVPNKLSGFDIFCALSREESFGVAVVEAQGVGIPVIVSNAPGFIEVVDNYQTGIIVQKESPEETSDAINMLYESKNLRTELAQKARENVELNYCWDSNVKQMIRIYRSIISEC